MVQAENQTASCFMTDTLIWLGIAVCLSQSAMFSGLNLAVFSLSRLRLEAAAEAGDRHAQRMLALRRNANFALTTILWGNVAINVLLTLLAESVLAGVAGGVLFVALVGWRLVPARERAGVEGFDAGAYLTEARVTEESKVVAGAMASTGAADLVARTLLERVAQGNAIFALAVILIVTMTLSNFMNNAATAAVMCPIAISTAMQLEPRADSFLMAVAIGASCAFLTTIGHQNSTLILGPGGFRFGDYWKLGLPLEILVIAISIPMLLLAWPL
jgi:hypothetical protein